MTAQATAYHAVAHYSKGQEGWSEEYFFEQTDTSEIITALQPILAQRQLLLPANASLIWVVISKLGPPRDGKSLIFIQEDGATQIGYPVPGRDTALTTPPVVTTTPKTEVCIFVRFEIASGGWSNRYIRCLPSSEFADDAFVAAITIPPAATAVTKLTWAAAMGNYIAMVRDQTFYNSKLDPTGTAPPTGEWDVEPWDLALIRGLTTRKTGRPFGLRRGRAIPR